MNISARTKALQFFLFAATATILAIRFAFILRYFNTAVTDNDQVLFWTACDNFSRGLFYTPFIYGCNYGSMLESLLAVPFYKLGLPLYYALPVSNAFWIYLSSVLLGLNLNSIYQKNQVGVVFLMGLALLPTELFVILFAAKGHLAGILVALLALILVSRSNSKSIMIIVGLLAGLAFQFNPNSVFLLLFIGFFVKSIKSAAFGCIGLAMSFIYFGFTVHFANIIDSEFLHKQWQITFSFAELRNNLGDMDKYLNAVTPVDNTKGFISLVLPLLLSVVLFVKKEWIKGILASLLFIMLFFSFGVNKVSDGSNDVLFHYSRFFLGIAFCNSIAVALLFTYLRFNNNYFIFLGLLGSATVFFLQDTPREARQIAGYCGTTFAVRKSLVTDLTKNCAWIIKVLEEKNESRQQIVVSDAVFYSENLYLSTLHKPNVICCFDNYKSFFWLKEAMIKNNQRSDIFFVINFDKTLAKKIKEYPAYYYKNEFSSYFLVRDIKEPANYIDMFLK